MRVKSYREMTEVERKSNSLEAKIVRGLITVSVLLGITLLATGLGLYGYSLGKKYIKDADHISKIAAQSAKRGTDVIGFADTVMERYRSLTDEQRALVGTEEYRELFADCYEDGRYNLLVHMFPQYLNFDEVSDVYIAMYDEQTCSIVYISDPDPVGMLYPGEWEPVNEAGMRKFLDYDGVGILYDMDKTDKYGWMCTVGTPICDSTGRISAFVLVDLTVDELWAGMRAYTLQITLMLLLIVMVLMLITVRRIKKFMVGPINEIAGAAQAYVDDKKAGKRGGQHFSKLDIHTGDEIENLGITMAEMEGEMADFIQNLASVTAEKERISTELSVANRIQAAMLPHIFPAFPDRTEFDVYATMDPAKEVGGDFYDYFLIDDDHLALVMADVSGKGVPAALFMMASKIMIANYAKMGKTPSEILTITNDTICSNNQEEMFVTVWLGVFEISTGKLIASNAGHEYPVFMRDGKFEVYKDQHGMVIGYEAGMTYKDYEVTLKPGDKLFLYTDGVPEATDKDEKLFGMERMVSALNTAPEETPEQILQNIREAVDEFVQSEEQFDDLTMLCFEYRSREQS